MYSQDNNLLCYIKSSQLGAAQIHAGSKQVGTLRLTVSVYRTRKVKLSHWMRSEPQTRR